MENSFLSCLGSGVCSARFWTYLLGFKSPSRSRNPVHRSDRTAGGGELTWGCSGCLFRLRVKTDPISSMELSVSSSLSDARTTSSPFLKTRRLMDGCEACEVGGTDDNDAEEVKLSEAAGFVLSSSCPEELPVESHDINP
jgi:hypothetical protein